jgi:hypothetical protein
MPSVSFVERHVKVLGPVIGAEAARAIAHRNALRAAALIVALLALVPAGTWAQMAGGPLAWSTAALTLAGTLGLFAVSVVFGRRAQASANAFVGQQLGYPVRLGSNLNVGEFRRAIEREKFFHAQGHRPRWGIYHAPKDSR